MAGDGKSAAPVSAGASSRQRGPLGIIAALVRVAANQLFETRRLARLFDDDAFRRIEAAIAAGESRHRGEIRFALEEDLTFDAARRPEASREHALAAFATQGIWDTEENSGILIFLQWPLHAIEIVADRGAARRVPAAVWSTAVAAIARSCEATRPVDGVIAAIGIIDDALAEAMPAAPHDRDELPNSPIRL